MKYKFSRPINYWRRQTFEYHPVIGWWHVKNLYAKLPLGGTMHDFLTNTIGMRSSHEYTYDCPEFKKRIVFLGDSYTAGDGVSNHKRFTDLLEARYTQLEALNFGLNGSGTDQQYLIYETFARHFEAHAYVFCICVENIARNLCTCRPSYDYKEHQVIYRPKPYFELENNDLVLKNYPVPREKRHIRDLGDWVCEFPYLSNHPDDAYAIYRYENSPHCILMEKILKNFIKKVSGYPVFIVPLPMKDHYLERSPATYWDSFKKLHDVNKKTYVIDVLTALKSSRDRDSFYFIDDPHYTESAHNLISNVLEYEINRYHPELLGSANA